MFGLRYHWTLPDIAPFLEPLEHAIADLLVPAITEHVTTQEEGDLLELPVHLGELGLVNPARTALQEYEASVKITGPLVRQIVKQIHKPVELTIEKGASNWLTVIPIKEMNFNLNKKEFRDATKLRYDWEITDIPAIFTCGDLFTIDHAMICRHGGLIIQRHNEIRDLEAEMLRSVCIDV